MIPAKFWYTDSTMPGFVPSKNTKALSYLILTHKHNTLPRFRGQSKVHVLFGQSSLVPSHVLQLAHFVIFSLCTICPYDMLSLFRKLQQCSRKWSSKSSREGSTYASSQENFALRGCPSHTSDPEGQVASAPDVGVFGSRDNVVICRPKTCEW
jgi:hypothetical protein